MNTVLHCQTARGLLFEQALIWGFSNILCRRCGYSFLEHKKGLPTNQQGGRDVHLWSRELSVKLLVSTKRLAFLLFFFYPLQRCTLKRADLAIFKLAAEWLRGDYIMKLHQLNLCNL